MVATMQGNEDTHTRRCKLSGENMSGDRSSKSVHTHRPGGATLGSVQAHQIRDAQAAQAKLANTHCLQPERLTKHPTA